MKKLFFYAAAALAMLASCQKAEISGSKSDIDDSKPAPILFGGSAPQTKAAITEWNNTQVFVYGLKQEGRNGKTVNALGNGLYDLSNAYIKDYEATALDGIRSTLEVYETGNVPYYYEEGETYDFFGYHLGEGATKGKVDSLTTKDQVTVGVTITGSQDVMVAYPDKVQDIKENATEAMGTDDVYSAWAARRGVQPTLKFQHALSRFNIIVRGMNDLLSEKVTIMGITANAQDSLDLVVVGAIDNLGATGVGEFVDLTLMNENGLTPYSNEKVVLGNTAPAGGANACFMLAPNMTQVAFTVTSMNNEHDTDLPDQTVIADASELVKYGDGLKDLADRTNLGATKFEAGKAYNIYINVYGPQEIKIVAELTDWKEGGDFVYDPDLRPGTGDKDNLITPDKTTVATVTANIARDANEETYLATLPASYTANNPFADAQATFPWVGKTLTAVPGTYTVKVCLNGDPVDINFIPRNWPADASFDKVSKKFTYSITNPCSYIGFEVVNELGGAEDADLTKYEIFVEYENVFTEIVNSQVAKLDENATADDYVAQLPAWYVEKYPYEAAQASFPWVGVTFSPVKAGTPIKIEVLHSGQPMELDPEKITWQGATIAADKKSMTVVKPSKVTYVGFEVVGELGLTPSDLGALEVNVTVE